MPVQQDPLMFLLLLVGVIVLLSSIKPSRDNPAVVEDPEVVKNNILIYLPKLGKLKGSFDETSWTKQNFLKFLGIPFAQSPTGVLRFQPPVPITKWEGVRDATNYGKRCPAIMADIPLENHKFDSSSEDCLNLCVYTKDFNAQRPVMVYIHGGAFSNGTALEHPGNFLMEKDIVYVAIQYRLGPLGFLSTQTKEIPGNMGILDVKLALEWIQTNIKYFGGNPNDVTVFGESAGGAIVSLLMVSPIIQKNLFHKAIIQSGSVLMSGIYDYNPVENSQKSCESIGCKNCDNIDSINECFKKATVLELFKAGNDRGVPIPFGLTIDDIEGVLPKKPKQLIMESTNEYQVMAGILKHDGGFLLAPLGQPMDPRDFITKIVNFLGESDESGTISNLVSKLYFKPGQLENGNLKELIPGFVDILSTICFKSPLQKFIELYSNNTTNNNYMYTLDYVGQHYYIPFVDLLQKVFPYYPLVGGVNHADDLLYLFPTKILNENDEKIAKTMVDLWTSFAINGQPKILNGPEILPAKNGKGPYFHINKKITIGEDFSDEFLAAINEVKN